MNETPIQRLQRLLADDPPTPREELQTMARVTLKNTLAIGGLTEQLASLERRLDGQAAAIRALAVDPADVAEAMTKHMLRSVDDE